MPYRVIDADGNEVQKGQEITSFRNEKARFDSCTHPRKITVTEQRPDDSWGLFDYYPTVFGLTIREV